MSVHEVVSTSQDSLPSDEPVDRVARAELLSGFMERVREFANEADSEVEDLVYEGTLGAVRLSYGEAEAIRRCLADTAATTGSSHGLLLAESLAMCLKIDEDVQDYHIATRVDDELSNTIRSVLELDLRAGEGLVQDFSEPIESAFDAELREQAVRLGEIRLAIRQHMAHVRRVLVGHRNIDDTALIPGACGSVAVLPEAPSDPDAEPPDQLEESRRRYRKLKRERLHERLEKMKMRRIRWLVIALGLAVVVAAAGFAYQLLPALETHETIILTIDDFEGVPGISSVLAKPPSLFVTVDGGYWDSLSRQSKRKIVVQVGDRLLKADYNGAVFTDTGDKVVGEWIRGVGSYVYPMQ
jgi:hypothetical protein